MSLRFCGWIALHTGRTLDRLECGPLPMPPLRTMPAVRAAVRGIALHFPDGVVDNEALARELTGWDASRFETKVGIRSRHIAAAGQKASDLAVAAALNLFAAEGVKPDDIDFVLVCTETPDHIIPSVACVIQPRLGLRVTCGAIDINQGSSGFVYGLALAKGLTESGLARNVLLITADTISTLLDPADQTTRPLFGDAATATWITASDSTREELGPFVFGTDGTGAGHLMVRDGYLRMNGGEIVAFTLRVVPDLVHRLLEKEQCRLDDIDGFVFHQPNALLLEQLRRKIGIPPEKFCIEVENCGNTVSSTIPIALRSARDRGFVKPGSRVLLAGFGAGLSWCGALLRVY